MNESRNTQNKLRVKVMALITNHVMSRCHGAERYRQRIEFDRSTALAPTSPMGSRTTPRRTADGNTAQITQSHTARTAESHSTARTAQSQTAPAAKSRPRLPAIRFRVLVIGRANAGKTSILQRVCETTESPTIYRAGKEVRRPSLCFTSPILLPIGYTQAVHEC